MPAVDPYRVRAQRLKTTLGTEAYSFSRKFGLFWVAWTVVFGGGYWWYIEHNPERKERLMKRASFDVFGLFYKPTELDTIIAPKLQMIRRFEDEVDPKRAEERRERERLGTLGPRKIIPQIAPKTSYPLGDITVDDDPESILPRVVKP